MREGSRADDERAIRDGFRESRGFVRVLEQFRRTHRRFCFAPVRLKRSHHCQATEPEVCHGPRSRTNVQRIARRDKNDFNPSALVFREQAPIVLPPLHFAHASLHSFRIDTLLASMIPETVPDKDALSLEVEALCATARWCYARVEASCLRDGRRDAGIGRYASQLIEALHGVPDLEVTPSVPASPAWSEARPARFLRAQPHVLSDAIARHPHLIHGLGGEPVMGFPMSRQVVTVHDVEMWRGPSGSGASGSARHLYGALLAPAIRACAGVIAVSESTRTEAVAALGLDPARVHVVPHGVGTRLLVASQAPRRPDRGGAGPRRALPPVGRQPAFARPAQRARRPGRGRATASR